MKYKQMLKIRKTEKDPQVRDRILLNVLKRDGMSVTGAARLLGMAPSWGVKWHNRTMGGRFCRGTGRPVEHFPTKWAPSLKVLPQNNT